MLPAADSKWSYLMACLSSSSDLSGTKSYFVPDPDKLYERLMADKDIRRLGRDDLLKMLQSQNREVKRLKGERDSLITHLRYYESELNKIGSLDAILARMGMSANVPASEPRISALEALMQQFENAETTEELFEERRRKRRAAKAADDTDTVMEPAANEDDAKEEPETDKTVIEEAETEEAADLGGVKQAEAEAAEDTEIPEPEAHAEMNDPKAESSEMRKPGFSKGAAKQGRLQEALAWAKLQFRNKKRG